MFLIQPGVKEGLSFYSGPIILFKVTPYSISDQWTVDWVKMYNAWDVLSPEMKSVGHLIGVEDAFLVKALRTNVNTEKNVSTSISNIMIVKMFKYS